MPGIKRSENCERCGYRKAEKTIKVPSYFWTKRGIPYERVCIGCYKNAYYQDLRWARKDDGRIVTLYIATYWDR